MVLHKQLLGPPHPTSWQNRRVWASIPDVGTAVSRCLAFLPSPYCSTSHWSSPLDFAWEWVNCHCPWVYGFWTQLSSSVHSSLSAHADRLKTTDINWYICPCCFLCSHFIYWVGCDCYFSFCWGGLLCGLQHLVMISWIHMPVSPLHFLFVIQY